MKDQEKISPGIGYLSDFSQEFCILADELDWFLPFHAVSPLKDDNLYYIICKFKNREVFSTLQDRRKNVPKTEAAICYSGRRRILTVQEKYTG